MKRSTLWRSALVVMGCLGLAAQVHAQVVQVEVVGLPPGAVVEFALSSANLNKAASATASSTGSLDTIFDFANLNKTPNPQGEQIQVFIIECKQPQEVRRVVFVAEGGQVPHECDEQRADTGQGCNCRRAVFVLFPGTTRIQINFQTGTVQPMTASSSSAAIGPPRHWVVVGGGPEFSRNDDVQSSPPRTGFSGPEVSITDDGWTGTFFVEAYPVPWLGGGYTYQSLSTAELTERFTFVNNPNFNVGFNSVFDPYAHGVYVVAVFPPNGPVQVAVRGGGNYFKSKERAVQTLNEGSQEIDRVERNLTASGWGPMAGAELRFWPAEYVGGGVRFTWEKLKHESSGSNDRTIDDTYYKLAVLVMVRF